LTQKWVKTTQHFLEWNTKPFTFLPHIHPLIHRQQCQPHKAPSSSSSFDCHILKINGVQCCLGPQHTSKYIFFQFFVWYSPFKTVQKEYKCTSLAYAFLSVWPPVRWSVCVCVYVATNHCAWTGQFGLALHPQTMETLPDMQQGNRQSERD